jgi:hypothetical protein
VGGGCLEPKPNRAGWLAVDNDLQAGLPFLVGSTPAQVLKFGGAHFLAYATIQFNSHSHKVHLKGLNRAAASNIRALLQQSREGI